MIVGNRSKEKHIYTGEWISVANRRDHRIFSFAVTSNPNEQEVTFENVDGISGDLYIKTFSTIPFEPDDIVIWRGYGNGKKYNVAQVIDGVDENEMARLNIKRNVSSVRYIQLRRAG